MTLTRILIATVFGIVITRATECTVFKLSGEGENSKKEQEGEWSISFPGDIESFELTKRWSVQNVTALNPMEEKEEKGFWAWVFGQFGRGSNTKDDPVIPAEVTQSKTFTKAGMVEFTDLTGRLCVLPRVEGDADAPEFEITTVDAGKSTPIAGTGDAANLECIIIHLIRFGNTKDRKTEKWSVHFKRSELPDHVSDAVERLIKRYIIYKKMDSTARAIVSTLDINDKTKYPSYRYLVNRYYKLAKRNTEILNYEKRVGILGDAIRTLEKRKITVHDPLDEKKENLMIDAYRKLKNIKHLDNADRLEMSSYYLHFLTTKAGDTLARLRATTSALKELVDAYDGQTTPARKRRDRSPPPSF